LSKSLHQKSEWLKLINIQKKMRKRFIRYSKVTNDDPKKFFVLLYIRNISEIAASLIEGMNSSRYSVISEYIHEYSHSFDWNNIEVFDSESNYKRFISEMTHKIQKNGINSQSTLDTKMVHKFLLLNALANNKFS